MLYIQRAAQEIHDKTRVQVFDQFDSNNHLIYEHLSVQSSRSEDFNDSDYMEKMANDWSPENGFYSENLKRNKDSYPRPAFGKICSDKSPQML